MDVKVKTSEDLFLDQVGGQQFIVNSPDTLVADASRHVNYELSPTSFQSGLPSSSGTVFRIQNGYSGPIETCYLEFTMSEQGIGPVTPLIVPNLISKIEIGLNSDPVAKQTITQEALMTMFQYMDKSTVKTVTAFDKLNMSKNYDGEREIQMSGSRQYRIPLLGSLLDGRKLNPQLLQGDVIVSVYMNTSPVASGSGVLHLTNMKLRIISRNQPDFVKANVKTLYQQHPSRIPFIDFQTSTWTGNLTGGSRSEIPLTGVSAECPALSVMIRANKSGIGLRQFSALGGPKEIGSVIDIVDNNKRSILGSGGMHTDFIRSDHMAEHVAGDQAEKIPIYPIYFAEHPDEAFSTGKQTGEYQFNGTQFLHLTPGDSYSGGTDRIDTFVAASSVDVDTPVAADNGNFTLVYTKSSGDIEDETDNRSYVSTPLDFASSVATIGSAITGMQIPNLSIINAGTMNALGGISLTTAASSLQDNDVDGVWNCISSLENTASYCVVDVNKSGGVQPTGTWIDGTYTVDVNFQSYAGLELRKGFLKVVG